MILLVLIALPNRPPRLSAYLRPLNNRQDNSKEQFSYSLGDSIISQGASSPSVATGMSKGKGAVPSSRGGSHSDTGIEILQNMTSKRVGRVNELAASTAETSKGVFRCKILFEEDMAGLFLGTTAEVRLASTSADPMTLAGTEKGTGPGATSQRGLVTTSISIPPRYIPDRAEEALSVEKLTLHIARFKYIFDCFMDWIDDYDR
jgi:hypothetical protein